MQTKNFRRVLRALVLPVIGSAMLAGCSNANDPYAKIQEAPLVQGRLHTVTLASADAHFAEQLQKAGYHAMPFPPNYPAADEVQGILWSVPPEVVKGAAVYGAPGAGPDVRVVVQPLPAAAPPADAGVERSFFRNVLGPDVPQWPEKVARGDGVRVLVWSYQVGSVLDARKKLRANSIPVITEPVAITTPYLGDQKSMSLRAPDGSIVELVETAAQ
jgi:hypothetical protein